MPIFAFSSECGRRRASCSPSAKVILVHLAAGLVQSWHGIICKKFAAIFLQIPSPENQCDICLRRSSNFDLQNRPRFEFRP